MKTILIHDAKFSILSNEVQELECAGIYPFEDGSAREFDPEATFSSAPSKRVRFTKFRRVIDGELTEIRLACDPEIQKLLGLQESHVANLEKMRDYYKNCLEDMREYKEKIEKDLQETKVEVNRYKFMSIWEFIICKLKMWWSGVC